MADNDRILKAAQRWEAMTGEARVNLIRLGAIVLFYLQHWILFQRIQAPTAADLSYHRLASLVVVLWGIFAALLQLVLPNRPQAWVSYLSTTVDLVLVTVLAVSSPGGGPRSPLLLLLLVIVAASTLRFSLRLIYFTTGLASLLYLLVLGHYAYVTIGYERYYSDAFAEQRIARPAQVIFGLALLLGGVIAAQAVRQARRLALVACARIEHDLTNSPAAASGQPGSEFELDLDEQAP